MNRLVILTLAVASVSCNLLNPLLGRSALGGVGGLFGINNNYGDSESSVEEKKEKNNMVRRVVTTHTEVYESDDEGQSGAGFRGGLSGLGGISDNKLRSRTSPGLHRLRGLRSGALSSALGGGIDNHVLGKSLSLGSALGSQIGHGGDLNKVQNLEYDFGDNSFDNHVNVNQMGGGFGDDFADFSTDALNGGFGGKKTTRKQRNKPIKGGDNIFGGSVVGGVPTLHPDGGLFGGSELQNTKNAGNVLGNGGLRLDNFVDTTNLNNQAGTDVQQLLDDNARANQQEESADVAEVRETIRQHTGRLSAENIVGQAFDVVDNSQGNLVGDTLHQGKNQVGSVGSIGGQATSLTREVLAENNVGTDSHSKGGRLVDNYSSGLTADEVLGGGLVGDVIDSGLGSADLGGIKSVVDAGLNGKK